MDKNKVISLPTWLLVNQVGIPFSSVEAAYFWSSTGGGMTVANYANEWSWSLFNTARFIEQLNDWHSSCSLGSIVVVGINNKDSFYKTTTTTTKENKRLIMIGDHEYPVEDSLTDDLYDLIRSSEDGKELIGYWIKLFVAAGYQLDILCNKTIGVAKSLAARGEISKAMDVLQWAFESDHYKAQWLRKKGMVFLFNLCNKSTLITNHQFYLTDGVKPVKKVAALPVQVDQFDENGFLIGGE
tara:strand:+ start:1396 stop:2118 length:723 start_codon:yes stop_codon:yes gene_type:complete